MALAPPRINTYHCLCTALLLATTHTLSTLPRRAPPARDHAYILPVPDAAPTLPSAPPSPSPSHEPRSDVDTREPEDRPLPPTGYTLLLGLHRDGQPTLVRREDGFERRLLWRCGRCGVVVGYELAGTASEKGLPGEGVFEGKVVYLLPNGVMSSSIMVKGEKIGEEGVEIGRETEVGVWE